MQKLQDFELHVGSNCGANASSGVFLRVRYEVQVETESAKAPKSHHTGRLRISRGPEQPRKPGSWQSFAPNPGDIGVSVIDQKVILA